jgi:phosphoribosylformimino-5-aminoimidazole carboxamide ribotide isomerase
MIVIPKLELLGGAQAHHGVAGPMVSHDPVGTARAWAAAGFSRLHVVDSDAVAGRGSNARQVEAIARDSGLEVQVASGSESTDQIEACLDAGATRVVLGPRALAELDWLGSTAETFPGALIVETTVRERRVVTRGWVRTLPVDLLDLVEDLGGIPLAALFVTSLDGADGGGLELALLEDVVGACAFPVLAEDDRPTMSGLYALEHRGLGAVVIPDSAFATELDPRSVAAEFNG